MARLVMLLLLMVHGSALALEKSSNRECASCHIMWLNEFKRTDVKPLIPYDPTPVTESGKQDVVSTKRMCLSCHDGFVLDSRDLWKADGHNHPTGQKPSEHITIPTSKGKEIFPLNDDGRVYCGTCHSAHSMDWDEDKEAIFLRMSNAGSKMCMACHFDRSTGPGKGNHPINEVVSDRPAELAQWHRKMKDDN
ncbi:MAG: hypothetical protein HUJ31_08785, partial [Pseudomonadales bacterium]|nr:hypothetical protein [Pseudomonadales bacterium]